MPEESEKRVRGDLLQSALMDEVAERLYQLQTFFAQTLAEGVTEPVENITVTNDKRRILAKKPWFSAEVINDGPNNLWSIVNTEKSFDPHLVKTGETYRVNMGRGVIKDVLLWCEPGETAEVRFVGSR